MEGRGSRSGRALLVVLLALAGCSSSSSDQATTTTAEAATSTTEVPATTTTSTTARVDPGALFADSPEAFARDCVHIVDPVVDAGEPGWVPPGFPARDFTIEGQPLTANPRPSSYVRLHEDGTATVAFTLSSECDASWTSDGDGYVGIVGPQSGSDTPAALVAIGPGGDVSLLEELPSATYEGIAAVDDRWIVYSDRRPVVDTPSRVEADLFVHDRESRSSMLIDTQEVADFPRRTLGIFEDHLLVSDYAVGVQQFDLRSGELTGEIPGRDPAAPEEDSYHFPDHTDLSTHPQTRVRTACATDSLVWVFDHDTLVSYDPSNLEPVHRPELEPSTMLAGCTADRAWIAHAPPPTGTEVSHFRDRVSTCFVFPTNEMQLTSIDDSTGQRSPEITFEASRFLYQSPNCFAPFVPRISRRDGVPVVTFDLESERWFQG